MLEIPPFPLKHLRYRLDVLSPAEADDLRDYLAEQYVAVTSPLVPVKLLMFGSLKQTREYGRHELIMGKKYNFNPDAPEPVEFTHVLRDLTARVSGVTGEVYNSVAINYYPTKKAHIGWHHDKKEPHLIASITLGGWVPKLGTWRPFEFGFAEKIKKNGVTKEIVHPVYKLNPMHGSLLTWSHHINDVFKHRLWNIPQDCEPRFNLTFRNLREN